MKEVVLSGVVKTFPAAGGAARPVLDGVDLAIRPGEITCLLGPSGCGKSTLLSLIAGFDRPSAGSVRVDGKDVEGPSPGRVVIFQDYALFPWRSALGNVVFALEAMGRPRKEARTKAEAMLRLVGLDEASHRHPHQLSGGQRQRVAIARALAAEPDMLLMDEPFAALDAFTRMRLQDELLRIQERRRMTVIFVTHDIEEAVYLGRRIALMSPDPGRITRLLENDLNRPCDRNSPGFLELRRELFEAFSLVHAEARAAVA